MGRYLIKVIYERLRKKPGSRLKAKIVGAFFVITTLPILIFFYVTNDFFSNKIAQWFRPQTSITLDHSIAILQDYREQQKIAIEQLPGQVVELLRTGGSIAMSTPNIDLLLKNKPVNGIVLYNLLGQVIYHGKNNPTADESWVPATLGQLSDPELRKKSRTDENNVQHSFRSFKTLVGEAGFLEIYIDEKILGQAQTAETLSQLVYLQQSLGSSRALNVNYKVMLMLISIVIMLALTWFGLYLSRTILNPVQMLIQGTEDVKAGNWDVVLPEARGRDELRTLLKNFNLMVGEIKTKSAQLNQRERELSSTNLDLRQRNQVLKVVFRHIEIGVVVIGPAGYITEINDQMEFIFNQGNRLGTALKFSSFFPAEISSFIASFQSLTKRPNKIEQSMYLLIGNSRHHLRVAIYTIETGNQNSQLLVVQDLTAIDALMKASAWQDVAKRVAHEIKNPLTPIRVSAERIIRKYYDSDPVHFEALKTMSETIIREVDFVKTMVNAFSNFAALPEIKPLKKDLSIILGQVKERYANILPKNIELEMVLAPIPMLLLDENQIKQAIQNIIQNSINAIGNAEAGKIVLQTEYVEKSQLARITITDNGPGIADDIVDRVFEPYVTTSVDGMGLGLVITQRIVLDHRGTIFVQSKAGATQFTIELPLAAA